MKNTKKIFEKKHVKDIEIFQKKKKKKGEKKPEIKTKILLKKIKTKIVSIIRNVSRSYLSIEEVIIQHIKSNYLTIYRFLRT